MKQLLKELHDSIHDYAIKCDSNELEEVARLNAIISRLKDNYDINKTIQNLKLKDDGTN